MKNRFTILLALILLLSVNCAACRSKEDDQPEESISIVESTNGPQNVTQTLPTETGPGETEFNWEIGEEEFDNVEKVTEPTKPVETNPAGTEPAETVSVETEPAETEPIETTSPESEWSIGEEDF